MYPRLLNVVARRLAALGRGLRAACRVFVARLAPRRCGQPLRSGPQPAIQANVSSRALTAAALALPGLVPSPTHAAEGDEFGFQYGRYQEGERDLFGVESKFDPILVDSLHGSASLTLFDRLKFFANYVQDTWSGATPIATVPQAFVSSGPNCSGGNCPTSPDGVSGATPFINGDLFFDSQFNPIALDAFGEPAGTNTQLVHTLSSASPETRKQGDFRLGYEWNEAALDMGGGLSSERDYESRWGSLGGRWDLNQKRTTLNLGLSYTRQRHRGHPRSRCPSLHRYLRIYGPDRHYVGAQHRGHKPFSIGGRATGLGYAFRTDAGPDQGLAHRDQSRLYPQHRVSGKPL